MNKDIKSVISILSTPDEKQNIEEVAKSCFTSTMQLQRDFYNVTGYSVGEYMRRVRLSSALCLMKNSDTSLADIAYSCGYSSQQSMCREIKTLIRTTATKYRKNNDYYFLSPMNDNTPFQIEVSMIKIPATLCLRYLSPILREIENNAVTCFLSQNPDYNGRIFGRNGKQQNNLLCYELYVETTNNLNTNEFEQGGCYLEYETIFAKTRLKNIEDEINNAWDYIYSTWLPESMFDYAGQSSNNYESTYFEEYYYKNGQPERLKLYLPVTRKKELLKISIEKSVNMSFLVATNDGIHAEKNASQRVIDYLSENHPYIIKNAKDFYFRQQRNCFTCGVQLSTDIKTPDDLHIINYKNTNFAVLYLNGIGDFLRIEKMLITWLADNNFKQLGYIFAVYNTDKSYEKPQMKLYCPIEIC